VALVRIKFFFRGPGDLGEPVAEKEGYCSR
jgi:hypothetical protein